ncbi:MAG: sulfotransferase domain-containing protein [Verrucomicrobiales bacterium]|nr:sulfotransferase domain-containing protein [Verrucomicrobiales bacterium]
MKIRSLFRRSGQHQLRESRRKVIEKSIEERFALEISLLKGEAPPLSEHRSVIHFSLNKSATQYVKSILRKLADEQGMRLAALNDYAFQSDLPYLDKVSTDEIEQYQHVFYPNGIVYSAFGGMVQGIKRLEDYSIILMIRDPRDILVSMYFSKAKIHRSPRKESGKREDFDRERSLAQQMSVDEYVLHEMEDLRSRFAQYEELLGDAGCHVHLVKYEDMVTDFDDWLDKLILFCDFRPGPKIIEGLRRRHRKRIPKAENQDRHLRKGLPGDYAEKLKPETISALNSYFSNVMKRFGYSEI